MAFQGRLIQLYSIHAANCVLWNPFLHIALTLYDTVIISEMLPPLCFTFGYVSISPENEARQYCPCMLRILQNW